MRWENTIDHYRPLKTPTKWTDIIRYCSRDLLTINKFHILSIVYVLGAWVKNQICGRLCMANFPMIFRYSSRMGLKSIVPPCAKLAKQRYQTLYEHSFAVLGPRLWNTVPKVLSNISCQQEFKDKLTTCLSHLREDILTATYCWTGTRLWGVALQSRWLATMAC